MYFFQFFTFKIKVILPFISITESLLRLRKRLRSIAMSTLVCVCVCLCVYIRVKSLDYALHSCFRKIFSTRDQVVVHHCMVFF